MKERVETTDNERLISNKGGIIFDRQVRFDVLFFSLPPLGLHNAGVPHTLKHISSSKRLGFY